MGNGRVVVEVVVGTSGAVTDAIVKESAGAAFDSAALQAVRDWRFEPARRDGVAIPVRIAIPFQFPQGPSPTAASNSPGSSVPGSPARDDETESHESAASAPSGDDPAEPGAPSSPREVHVRGSRHSRAAGDFHVHRDVLRAAPRSEGAEVLRSAPGVYIARSEGNAIAHSYMLRGFDAEHGQDITFRVGGLPINLPSHIHGQGYADLGFLIAETTRELRVREGLYDPHQGDFAVAGSIDLELGVESEERGITVKSGYGSYGTHRHMVSWAPIEAPEETFGAVQLSTTDGFGQNRSSTSGSAIVQHRFGAGNTSYRAVGVAYGARANLAGVVRQDDVAAGRICFTCVYDHPSARAQNALASRVMLGLFADYDEPDEASGQLGVWFSYDTFRSQQNFTGFIERSRTLEGIVGRGDLIEQQNRTLSLGLSGEYRSPPLAPAEWLRGTIETGAEARVDGIDQAQNLLDATVRNQTWDQRVDASIRGLDLGFFGDLDFTVAHLVRARLGLRADLLAYEVEDRLGNFAPSTRPDDAFITGFRRSALGVAAGPRTSVEARPLPYLALLAAYGEGYRSPQARTLEDGEDTPFTKVRSLDVGIRLGEYEDNRLTLGGYYTHLSDDVAFEASEGRLERVGATQRTGLVLQGVAHPIDQLVVSGSVTVVQATLLEPPPASAEEPSPPFVEGQQLPFVPPRRGARRPGLSACALGQLRRSARPGIQLPVSATTPVRQRCKQRNASGCFRGSELWSSHRGARSLQRAELRVRRDRVQLRLRLEPERRHSSPHASPTSSRGLPTNPHAFTGADTVTHWLRRRTCRLLACTWVLASACGDAGQRSVNVPLFFAGTPPYTVQTLDGSSVRLESARVAVGPLYLCSGETAGQLCETARAEWLETAVVDATSSELQRVGDLSGASGDVRSWMMDFAISSQLTQSEPIVLEAAQELSGFSVQLRAVAEREGTSFPLEAALVLAQRSQSERGVPVLRSGASEAFLIRLEPDTPGLAVHLDSSPWFTSLDLSNLSPNEQGTLLIEEGSAAYSALLTAAISGQRPRFERLDELP